MRTVYYRNTVGIQKQCSYLTGVVRYLRSSTKKEERLCMFHRFKKKILNIILHAKPMTILNKLNLAIRGIKLILNLHWNWKRKIKPSEEFDIIKGERKGYVLTLLIFNVHSETILKESLGNRYKRISVINNLALVIPYL